MIQYPSISICKKYAVEGPSILYDESFDINRVVESYRNKTQHTGLEALPSKKKFPLMGQVFLNSLDQCGCGMGWQNLRKWEKN